MLDYAVPVYLTPFLAHLIGLYCAVAIYWRSIQLLVDACNMAHECDVTQKGRLGGMAWRLEPFQEVSI